MSKWILSRRALLLSTFASFFSGSTVFASSAPSFKAKKVLSSSSIQFVINSSATMQAYIEYGIKSGVYTTRSSSFSIKKSTETLMVVNGLKPSTKYFARLRYSANGKTFLFTSPIQVTTPAATGSSLFAIQADPHMDENSSADVYNKTLDLIAASGASFLMDLGDIFMVDKLADKSEANIRARYELMKGYYARLKGVPLKIVLGNHDGELGYSSFNTKKYRAEYFPEQTSEVSYFSIAENNVLHVALDPFTYTTSNPKADGWQWTLGKTQYDWLVRTLQNSQEQHKFVYLHHLLVGDAQSRGGTHIANFNEWGGKNLDGTYGFDQQRPGWGKPIHQLLKDYGVAIVFKGHDHLYVKEELDGIIYQTLPQPSHPGEATNSAIPYGYSGGKIVGGSGYLRVKTDPTGIVVDFVKYDGSIADTYSI